MIQVRVSFESDAELKAASEALKPLGLRVIEAPRRGKYRRAYSKKIPKEVKGIVTELSTGLPKGV